jgi:hypothetical protein
MDKKIDKIGKVMSKFINKIKKDLEEKKKENGGFLKAGDFTEIKNKNKHIIKPLKKENLDVNDYIKEG